MKKPVKIFLKVFLSIILIFVIFIVGCSVAIFSGCAGDVDDLNITDVDLNIKLSSYVYCIDPETGKYVEYEKIDGSGSVWANLEDIPIHVQQAAIAIEDERFYNHSGVDIMSTFKATFGYVFNKSTARGGSTITQQLVKNLTGDSEKNVSRKVQEMARAIQLEKELSKDEILELYLNSIYLSRNCYGINSAARYYFDKDISELTIAEGACLVGITQYPSLYDPISNPDKNKEKQKLVLGKMLELGYISDKEYDEAVSQELVFIGEEGGNTSEQSYFVDEIIEQVIRDLQKEYDYTREIAEKIVYYGGLKIYSTVDPEIQDIAERVFANTNNLAANSNGELPQASMCVMDPYTGEVKAIIGGFGEKEGSRTKRRATDNVNFPRQPGSTFKPVAVYAPAVENGLIDPYTEYYDKQLEGKWSPKNYYDGFLGKVTVKYAVDKSINTVPVQILKDDLGVDKSFEFVTKNMGITSLVQSDKNLPALSLGGLTKGVSNMELTAAYCSFVNDGVYNTPITYTKVVDSNGNVILEKKSRSTAAMSSSTAKTMNSLLYSVCNSSTGTGTPARFGGYNVAGKTGTTDNDVDRWFVGYTPYYCAAVWVGFDDNKTTSYIKANPTIPLWRQVMEEVHSVKNLSTGKSFDYELLKHIEPSGISEDVEICSESGLKATEYCPVELVTNGTPAEDTFCNIHTDSSFYDPDEESPGEDDGSESDGKTDTDGDGYIDDSHLSDTGL